jgi:fucose 4-O-acetylase-like acetyltransferase
MDLVPVLDLGPEAGSKAARPREIYIDAFRGLMALVMVQGHVFDALLTPTARAAPLYQLQMIAHGSTAPGFLFASGFVAGLPRAPLSLRATVRRAKRLLFVLFVGYALHLPYLSAAKTLNATAAEKAALWACDALQVIALTQLFVLGVQWAAGRRWTVVSGALALGVLVTGPFVWASRLSARVPLPLGACLDDSTGSHFPVFPFAAFVLAGTVAGAALGRQDEGVRRRRARIFGAILMTAGALLAIPLDGVVDFWGVSPAYALLRLGGLLILLQLVEKACRRSWPGIPLLALLGHETLLVFVFHLYLLFGWVAGAAPLGDLAGRVGFTAAAGVTLSMVPVLLVVAWLWHRAKEAAPHEMSLALAFATTLFAFEFVARPW